MKNRAFTLVELLVVVLIIGILAAIAVPQYQKSILKSRFSTLVPIAKALNDGQEMFLFSNGKYADKLENLDVEIVAGASGSTANINGNIITLGANKRHTYVKATKENFDNNLIMFQKGSRYFPGEIHCEAKTGKILANWLCQNELGGTKLDRSLTEGYTDYVIKGDGNGFFPKDWVDVSGTYAKKLKLSNGDTCTGTEEWECQYLKISDGECYGETMYTCLWGTFVNSICDSVNHQSCSGSFTDSSCIANGEESCMGSSYLNSTCEGNRDFGCYNSSFKDSSCTGKVARTCHKSSFNNSECYGNAANACIGSTFKGNSICYANEDGACGDWELNGELEAPAVYEGNACCSGEFCPGYAPKCDCDIDPSTGQHALSC